MTTRDPNDFVKVHVTFVHDDDDGPPVAGEYIWAIKTGTPNQYEINNIPFFADFGLGDIVATEPHVVLANGDEYDNEILTVVKPSGNLTTRLFFSSDLTDEQRKAIGSTIRMYDGCQTEWANSRLLAVSISPRHTVEAVLGEYVRSGAAICDLLDQEELSGT